MPHDAENKSTPRSDGSRSEPRSARISWWTRRAAAVVMVISVGAILWAMPILDLDELLQHWSQDLGYWGVAVYMAAFVISTVFSTPVWPLPFIAGALFGTLAGTLIASTSIGVAASVTFWISRFSRQTWLRACLEASPRMRALEKTIEKSDWKAVAAVRVSHMFTFGMQNYALGLTQVGYRTFVVTTVLVTFPGTLLQVYVGHLGFASVDAWQSKAAPQWQTWGMRIGGLIVVAAAVLYIGHLWRNVYRDAVEQQLRKELEAETARTTDQTRWSWWTLVLLVLAVGLAGLAAWAVADREAFQGYVEQALVVAPAVPSQRPAAGPDAVGSGHLQPAGTARLLGIAYRQLVRHYAGFSSRGEASPRVTISATVTITARARPTNSVFRSRGKAVGSLAGSAACRSEVWRLPLVRL